MKTLELYQEPNRSSLFGIHSHLHVVGVNYLIDDDEDSRDQADPVASEFGFMNVSAHLFAVRFPFLTLLAFEPNTGPRNMQETLVEAGAAVAMGD